MPKTSLPRAREVLSDCEHALSDFAAGANTPYQRPRWLALVTLLRSVLDVIEKVDGPAGTPALRERIQKARGRLFEGKPEPRIFHEFIEDERNDVVHEYSSSAIVNVIIRIGAESNTHEFVMRRGPFKGRDPRELGREAIELWRSYLDDIDA